jgi:hypothetical protein
MESELRYASASISWSRARDDSTWRNSSSSCVIATGTAPLLAAEDDERRRGLPTAAGDGGASQRRSSTARRNRSSTARKSLTAWRSSVQVVDGTEEPVEQHRLVRATARQG